MEKNKKIIDLALEKLEEIEDLKTEKRQNTYLFAVKFFDMLIKSNENQIEIIKDVFALADEVFSVIKESLSNFYEKKIQQTISFAQMYGEPVKVSVIEQLKQELKSVIESNNSDYEFVIALLKEASKSYREPKEIIEELEKKGYKAYCIEKIELIYSTLGIDSEANNCFATGYDIVTNGTFYGPPLNSPYGIIIKDGEYIEIKNKGKIVVKSIEKLENRGCIAVLDNGKIKYDIVNYDYNEVKKKFEKNGLKIKDFMGGGALLIQNGKKITSKELGTIQGFYKDENNKDKGFEADQMRPTFHLMLGECNGYNFVIAPRREKYEFEKDKENIKKYEKELEKYKKELEEYKNNSQKKKPDKPKKPMFDDGKYKKHGIDLQNEIYEIGFTSLIKYDGGKAFYFKTKDYCHNGGLCDNHCGWAIKAVNLK